MTALPSDEPRPGAGFAVLVAVFALLYGLAEFAAVSNLIALPGYYDALGIGGATPWPLLVIGVVIPPALFAIALILGRARPLLHRGLLLATGLAVAHALALGFAAFVVALLPIGG